MSESPRVHQQTDRASVRLRGSVGPDRHPAPQIHAGRPQNGHRTTEPAHSTTEARFKCQFISLLLQWVPEYIINFYWEISSKQYINYMANRG